MRSNDFEVSVVTPCSELWSEMRGDARVRSCDLCRKTVHDLAVMTPREVGKLAMRADAGDAICGRVTKRSDGSVVMLADEAPRHLLSVRAVVLSAALAAGLPAAAQVAQAPQALSEVPPEPVTVPGQAVVIGQLRHPDGSRVESGLIYLSGVSGGPLYLVDDRGRFEIHAAPGVYDIVMQTGPDEAERVVAVNLHEGVQSFGEVATLRGQQGWMDGTTVTLGEVVGIARWSWRARFRHPVLYARSMWRRMS